MKTFILILLFFNFPLILKVRSILFLIIIQIIIFKVLAEVQLSQDDSEFPYTKDNINYIITGSCLYTYSKFVNEFKRVSRNSLLWPKLAKNESNAKLKHRFNEKYAMFSSFMAIKKILQIQSRYSVNNDYLDTVVFLRVNIALMEATFESKLDEMPEDAKIKAFEIKKRVIGNNFILNKYYQNKLTILNVEKKNLFKIFLRYFIYPAYLDLYNYGNIILSRINNIK
ncbi:uncharacterized protein ELE39_002130 [Cryptosporidium sp. chipmunk genotype I]|uniref:uncharacterized protein n=1 Tax=Cryptosporidium sp. chipmunk genotype I TaxID=1280935 RepID=UPI00351A5787|nr:hypothetical protein ELE39_002130 [Cryptosporidium sp. chipmunk genotype I]